MAAMATTINVKPGDNLASLVAAAPAGTTFQFSAGIYRLQSMKPKNGDTFIGPVSRKAVLDGSTLITFSRVSGSSPALWSAHIGSMSSDNTHCYTGHTLCGNRRELYLGGQLIVPVSSKSALAKGKWYYDASSGSAIINYDPNSSQFKIGTTACAFCGYAANVTIENLLVENYATPSQSAAVGQWAGGTYWTVKNVESRYNHAAGVKVGPNSTVEGSYIHHNGQLGLGAHGANIVVENNEFSYNNYDWFSFSNEAGGAKLGSLNTALISNNYSHHNIGAGLWDDTGSKGVHYVKNRAEYNLACGIQHEIGYDAVIEENTSSHNGMAPRVSMWDGQISVQNSSKTIVRNNTVTVSADFGSGLVIINQDRGIPNTNGSYNTIENNDVTYEGKDGQSGLMGLKSGASGNVLDYNTYHINPNLNHHHYEDFGIKTFDQFRDAGYEAHGKQVWVK